MTELTPTLLSQIAGKLFQDAVAADALNSSPPMEAPLRSPAERHPPAREQLPSSTDYRSPSIPHAAPTDQLTPPISHHLPSTDSFIQPPVPFSLPPVGRDAIPLPFPSLFPLSPPAAPDGALPQAFHSFGSGAGFPGTEPPGSFNHLKQFVEQVQTASARPSGDLLHPTSLSMPRTEWKSSQLIDPGSRPLDIPAIRRDFPILRQTVHGKPLVWFDNAATTQKPQCVIDAISNYYTRDNSNIHRAAHSLAARSTDAFEGARKKVQQFLGAGQPEEIIFVRGTTEGINLITQTYGRKFLQPGDEVILSTLEHHANIVPWQAIAKERGAVLRIIPVTDRGEIMLEEYHALLGPRTKVVALTQASNSLGTILPVTEMTAMARRYHARVVIDGAQSVAHIPVNVQQMDCDFFVFSGHKIFGPTGIGAVYAKSELQEIMSPWQGGGNMIRNVTFEETTYAPPPAKFEAGTPNIADAVGLGAALDYVTRLGLPNIAKYEHELLEYATAGLAHIPGLRLVGTAREKVGVLSFVLDGKKTEEVGKMLDLEGIAVRAGHHCSQPSLRRYGLESTVRPSLAFYNTKEEIDRLVCAVRRIQGQPAR